MRELRNIRLRRGLSQADLSAKAGVAEYTISEIEAGKRTPRPSTLRKLAQGLGVEVADLYGEADNPLAEAPPSAEQRSFNNHLLEERRARWDAAVRNARRLREGGRTGMNELLSAWRASKERGEPSDERRGLRATMGELLQQAYDAEWALWALMSGADSALNLNAVDLDDFEELQAADRFYVDLWRMVQRAEGLSIRTDAEETTGTPETVNAGDSPPAARPEAVVELEAA